MIDQDTHFSLSFHLEENDLFKILTSSVTDHTGFFFFK